MPEFHIHADLHDDSPVVEEFLKLTGAYADPFLHCEAGMVTYAPRRHYTFKTPDSVVFKKTWNTIERFLDEKRPEWTGYFEAEALFGGNTRVPAKPFDPTVPFRSRLHIG